MNEEEAYLTQQVIELKEKLRRKVKEELSELRKEEFEKEFKKCPICGASNFKGCVKSFLSHWFENHESKYGDYTDFRKSYAKHLSKLNKRLDKEYDRSVSKKLDLELFMKALRNPATKREELAKKMIMPLIRKTFQELRHTIFEQKMCPICHLSSFLDELGEPIKDETVEKHMQRMHSKEWEYYLNLGRATEGNLQALSEEKEELSTDSKLVQIVTKKEESKETKTLAKAFSRELVEKLSKKKKHKLARKTR